MCNLQKEFTGVVGFVSDGLFNNRKGKWGRIDLDKDVFGDRKAQVYINTNTPESEIEQFIEKHGFLLKGMRITGEAAYHKDSIPGFSLPIVQKFNLIKS